MLHHYPGLAEDLVSRYCSKMDSDDKVHVVVSNDGSEQAVENAVPEKPDGVQRDRHGFPLFPQPTRFRDDPLVSEADFS
jgi:hypothetical protein